ncbi:MAG: polysaccharide biosynthesis C-terminal domain-containing protein [Bacteroidia bacterium]|nr:polysaccharide biosynthesis C-terminal domain-containing protein [Bacteroidia bacterium]
MLFKKISYSVITRALVACINFFVLIISSRYLGAETRGQISLLILNIANVQMLSEIFTGYALVHFIPKFSLKKIFIYGLIWIILVLLIGTLILYYLNYLIPFYEAEFVIISIMVILNTFCMVIILGKENIRLYNWLSVLQPLILLMILAFDIFIEKKFVLDSYIDALLYSFGIALIINMFSVLQYLKQDRLKDFALISILSNGFLSQWSNWMHLLANRFGYYVLSIVSLQGLGIYSTATSLIESVFVIYSGISTVVLSYVSNESDAEKSKRITLQAATGSLLFTILAVLVILGIPEDWLVWILGNGFAGIKTPMAILSLGVVMISFSAVFSHYYSARGVLKYNAISNTISCLFTVLFSYIFIQKWGISGAAMVASISYVIEAMMITYFFWKHERIQWSEIWNKGFWKHFESK